MSIEAMKQALEFIDDVYAGEWHGSILRREQVEQSLRQAIAEAEQDKPVAVVTGVFGGRFVVDPTNPAMVLPVNMALYTHPKPREWVDLTEDEMVSIRSRVQEYTPLDSVKYGEAIQRATAQELKEKNSAST